MAVAVLRQRRVDIAALPPGPVADAVETVVRAAGRPRELDGAILFEAPRPRRAVERVRRLSSVRPATCASAAW